MVSLLSRLRNSPLRGSLTRAWESFGRLRAPLILLSAVAQVLFLGAIDILTGPEISFSVFYLLPISLATWWIGGWAGVSMSVCCAITWRVADSMAGQTYSHPFIPFWNMLVRLGFFLVTTLLMSEVKRRLEWEKESARTDPLTGIANRRRFYELAQMQIARSVRYGDPFTVAYVDIDNFKIINDRFGHTAGDALLSMVADTMEANIRAVDAVARMGGDEFAILLSGTGSQRAQEVLLRVTGLLSDMVRERAWPVTFSLGAVTFVRPPHSVEETIKTADGLMYAAKQARTGFASLEVGE